MLTHKTWALAALGLAVSALINTSFAHETNHSIQGDSPAGPTDQPSTETARDGRDSRLSSVSPISSFISRFLETDGPGEKRLRLPKLERSVQEESVRCLALNIYHEARAEPEKGQLAVAAVTLNRVASPAFPNSVCKVVKQGGKKRNGCQFSWWCDRHPDEPREAEAWRRALELSRKALGGEISDPTDGALYYHATRVKPRWARSFARTGKIGRHLFYKPEGA
ncbi:MAG: cell wall hydrolase [Bdellovibrio bacteriovorus]